RPCISLVAGPHGKWGTVLAKTAVAYRLKAFAGMPYLDELSLFIQFKKSENRGIIIDKNIITGSYAKNGFDPADGRAAVSNGFPAGAADLKLLIQPTLDHPVVDI